MDDIVIPHALYSVHIHATIIPQAQIVRKETAGAHDGYRRQRRRNEG